MRGNREAHALGLVAAIAALKVVHLQHHLPRPAQELHALLRGRSAGIPAGEQGKPSSRSTTDTASDRLGCETDSTREAATIDPVSAIFNI